MPLNKNALIRYKTIDACLQNRARTWTLKDLVNTCSEALYEYEGVETEVGVRTIQLDIQLMRSDKLGYEAPIVVINRKFYTYTDPQYSITKKPLSNQDLENLQEITTLMRHFKGFGEFSGLQTLVNKLEDNIRIQKTNSKPIIYLENNTELKGLSFLDQLYKIIIQRAVIMMSYKNFSSKRPNSFAFHPWYLKEYRNRWYVFGVRENKKEKIVNLALDRVENFIIDPKLVYFIDPIFDLEEYLKSIVGVTVANRPYENVVFVAKPETAPYIITKPIHHSQQHEVLPNQEVEFCLRIKINTELEKELLAFGETVPTPYKLDTSCVFATQKDTGFI